MKKDLGVKTILFPMPVLIIATYNSDGSADAMNAAWGGIHDTNQIGICIAPEHKTAENILQRKAFTVSMADAAHVTACDYVGIVSGNDVPDKLERAGLTVSKSEKVDAPVINELGLCLECELVSYDVKTGCLVGNIVNVCADEQVLVDGKIDVEKLAPLTYDPVNLVYRKPGEIVAKAFSEGKKLAGKA
jgi:flavin reductase (DIM6/NTAB) family NADH-FMN oxidoreductase RutF